MYNIRMIDVGHYAPENVVTNADLCKVVETDEEWILTRTGINSRHITLGETTSDFAYEACKNFDLTDVDLIVVSTFTADQLAPTTADMLQMKLGIEEATCFDVSAGCTGFIYAMKVVGALLQSGMHKKAIVVGAETLSKVTEWDNRSTCVLFGDGAGAVLLERSEQSNFKSFYTKSIVDHENVLYVEGIENTNFMHKGEKTNPVIKMDGTKVFKFASKVVVDAIEKALEQANLTIDDIACIIPHQANERIIKSVSKGSKIPLNKFYLNIDSYGNTSSASIPIALSEAVQDGTVKRGDYVLLVGFGAGLTWGSTIFKF